MAVWYIFSRFSWLHQEKSGNPEPKVKELTRIEVESFLRDFLENLSPGGIFISNTVCFFPLPAWQGCQMVHFQTKKSQIG
jgi:hypothetical protein